MRRWVRHADIYDGVGDGQTSAEQSELVQLPQEKRRRLENKALRRAAAYFAAGSLPQWATRWSATWPPGFIPARLTFGVPGHSP